MSNIDAFTPACLMALGAAGIKVVDDQRAHIEPIARADPFVATFRRARATPGSVSARCCAIPGGLQGGAQPKAAHPVGAVCPAYTGRGVVF